jgi:hypothetical protein
MTIFLILAAIHLALGLITLVLAWPAVRRAWGVLDGLWLVYALTGLYALAVVTLWPFLLRDVLRERREG